MPLLRVRNTCLFDIILVEYLNDDSTLQQLARPMADLRPLVRSQMNVSDQV